MAQKKKKSGSKAKTGRGTIKDLSAKSAAAVKGGTVGGAIKIT